MGSGAEEDGREVYLQLVEQARVQELRDRAS
jgi:hypothetical protein